MPAPTPFADLNDVLDDLVESIHAILGDNFCGAYLKGSFAIGDADEHSDIDFIVVTNDELTDTQVEALQAMHKKIHALESPWAQHLEGSYAPKDELRHMDDAHSPFWYLDNGATELIRDNHCNTAVVRWSLREKGVVLAGPAPKSLIEPVTAGQLRADVLAAMYDWAEGAPAPTKAGPMSKWKQTLFVLSYSRMLHALETGTVVSKRVAGEWALETLDPEWGGLIQQALADRPDPWIRVYQPADPELIERTLAFVEYAMSQASAQRPR